MMSTEIQTRSREPWPQYAGKLNLSTMEIWRRSTSLWYDSKDRCHQTTMEAWHRSADTLSHSKTRCRRSTMDILSRSANKWHQSAERLHRLSFSCEKGRDNTRENTEASTPNETAQSSQSPPPPQTPEYPQSSGSPHSPSATETDPATPTSNQTHTTGEQKNSPEEQIREMLNLTDQVVYQANQAKQLRNSKTTPLSEIEPSWINSTILEANNAARDLAKLVEPYRLDMLKRKGKMRSGHRKSWKLVDYQSASEKLSGLFLHRERLDKLFAHIQHIPDSPQSPINEPSVEILPELSAEMSEAPAVVELPCEPVKATPESESTLVELPASSHIAKSQSLQPLPKIIVTQSPDDSSPENLESHDAEIFAHENEETNEILYWDQTRDSIRLQQSESLSNIVAKMESMRAE